jgi:death-on-curing protein
MQYVSLTDALQIVDSLGFHVKDLGLLDSALARPSASMFGVDAYETLEGKAAALHQSLVKNRSLIDGNKRCSWFLLNLFLELNAFALEMTTDQGLDFTLGVAEGRYELERSAEIIKAHFKSL